MTESTRSRSSSRKSTASSEAAAPEPAVAAETPSAEIKPAKTRPSAEVARPADVADTASTAAAGGTPPSARTPLTLTIQLPFFTATLTGPQPASKAPAPPPAAAARPDTGALLEKMAFYGGVAAAGAVGAIEWPVALAVAAGTWIAQHTPAATGALPIPRPPARTREPAQREPAEKEPALVGGKT